MKLFHIELLYTVLYGVVLGFLFGFFYDGLRLWRYAFRLKQETTKQPTKAPLTLYDLYANRQTALHSKKSFALSVFFLFLQDYLFCIAFAGAVAVLIFFQNDGVVRWYPFVACGGGFLLYQKTLGKLVMGSAQAILRTVYRVTHFVADKTLFPLLRLLRKLFLRGKRMIANRWQKRKTERYLRSLPQTLSPFDLEKEQTISTERKSNQCKRKKRKNYAP